MTTKTTAHTCAAKIGVPIETYNAEIAASRRWCGGHKEFHDVGAFTSPTRSYCRDYANGYNKNYKRDPEAARKRNAPASHARTHAPKPVRTDDADSPEVSESPAYRADRAALIAFFEQSGVWLTQREIKADFFSQHFGDLLDDLAFAGVIEVDSRVIGITRYRIATGENQPRPAKYDAYRDSIASAFGKVKERRPDLGLD